MTLSLRVALVVLALLATASLPTAATGADTDPVGVWPLSPEPAVVRPFEPPATPYGPGHRGVDLLGRAGQPVGTALAGTVTYAGMLAGRGVVVVSHGATRTTYQPVTATVTLGQAVGRGDALGTLELSGSHCLPRACLHWGWIAGETYLDPLRLVGLGPVRLLPLWRDEPATERPVVSRSPGAVDLVRLVGALGGTPPGAGLW